MNTRVVIHHIDGSTSLLDLAWSQLCAEIRGLPRGAESKKFWQGRMVTLPCGKRIKIIGHP